ncbi:MAG: polyprenyl synthetase family protein [Gemmatimonadota bacterium]|nr:polyprenyl synthetase family protein [Gemmatimonadota bacterium]
MDLERARHEVDQTLKSLLAASLVEAPSAVASPIRFAVLAPGKRVRPLLLMATHTAARQGRDLRAGERTAVFRMACSVELVHAYSLVHDDLPCMDDDDLRRGRPTLHVEFGDRAAVLAGAALMPLAVEVLSTAAVDLGIGEAAAGRLVGILTAASGGAGMVGGQLLDLRAEGRSVGIDELDLIHEGKTARLIEACCLMGGVAAGAEEAVVERLGRYGRALGLAFQVVDDILDVTGSAKAMGKTSGRDAELGKATYPNIVGLEGARARADGLVDVALDQIAPLGAAGGLAHIARLVVDRER